MQNTQFGEHAFVFLLWARLITYSVLCYQIK